MGKGWKGGMKDPPGAAVCSSGCRAASARAASIRERCSSICVYSPTTIHNNSFEEMPKKSKSN